MQPTVALNQSSDGPVADLHISPSKFAGKVELAFNFDRTLPKVITQTVPSSGRRLVTSRRVWVLDQTYLPKLVEVVLATGRQVIDHRVAAEPSPRNACENFLKVEGGAQFVDEINALLENNFGLSLEAARVWDELRRARSALPR